jgi:serine/threonine-protein kinase
MASTIRLWVLAGERGDTSPFLHGFTPPLYIHNLADDEARDLIEQANLPSESRPAFTPEIVERIRSHCDNHPYLVQLLCKRFMELGDIEEAILQVAADPMLGFFFSVDFDMLSETERGVLRVIADQDSSTSNTIQDLLGVQGSRLDGVLHRLEHLGYIRRNPERRFVLVNYFFRKWFRETPDGTGRSRSDEPGPREPRAAWAPPGDSATRIGLLGNRYELLQKVGQGAMGEVYRAHDSLLDATIAVKLLRKDLAGNPGAIERLRREILLSRDIAHPNIVRIYHLGESAGVRFLTMQWVDGETLAARIAREAPMPPDRVIEIGRKLAGALAAAHAVRVLHRDIKPTNILMNPDGEPLITDFGLARLVGGPGETLDGVFVGTPDYASPEQARGGPVDERADLYALGLTLFEMATGRRPFLGTNPGDILELHRTASPPEPRSLRADLPEDLSGLILRCLEKDLDRRVASAAELKAGLERVAG